MAGQDSERDLVTAVRGGSEKAFRALYDRLSPSLLRLLHRLLGGNAAGAEEVLQDTWVAAVDGLDGFRGSSTFRTWLASIAARKAVDRIRQDRRGEAREVLLDPESDGAPRIGDRIDLERAIERLPAGYRVVFVLHAIEGYTHAEIADRIGIAEGTSRSQYFKARAALRARLAPSKSTEDRL